MTDYLSLDTLQPKLASKTSRWLASLIDYIIFMACDTGCLLFFGKKTIDTDGVITYHADGLPALAAIASWWVLLPVLEGLTGQTIGKAIFNIKTVKASGLEATIGACIVRHLFDIVDYFPFLGIVGLMVASNNKLKQRVGDLVAKTIVIKSN